MAKRLLSIFAVIGVLIGAIMVCANNVLNGSWQQGNMSLALGANINMSEAVKKAMDSNIVMAKGLAFNSGLTNVMMGLVAAVALFVVWKMTSALLSGGGSHSEHHSGGFAWPWSATPPHWISIGTDMHSRIDRLPRRQLPMLRDRLYELLLYVDERMGYRGTQIDTMTALPPTPHRSSAIVPRWWGE